MSSRITSVYVDQNDTLIYYYLDDGFEGVIATRSCPPRLVRCTSKKIIFKDLGNTYIFFLDTNEIRFVSNLACYK